VSLKSLHRQFNDKSVKISGPVVLHKGYVGNLLWGFVAIDFLHICGQVVWRQERYRLCQPGNELPTAQPRLRLHGMGSDQEASRVLIYL